MDFAALDPVTLAIVCPLVFLAMMVDAIAGGGGLISLTAYMVAGLPAHTALGTNKVTGAIGTVIATGRFAKSGLIKLRLAIPAVVFALIGSYVGARIALVTPDGVIQTIMVFALPVVAFFVLRKRTFEESENTDIPLKRQIAIIAVASLFTGAYDGFYGPGTGTFMLIAFTAAAKLPVREANGEVKCANLASNVAALITFASAGSVWWELGLVASVFAIAGSYVGAGLVMKDGAKVVRPVMLVVLVLLFIKVLYDLLF